MYSRLNLINVSVGMSLNLILIFCLWITKIRIFTNMRKICHSKKMCASLEVKLSRKWNDCANVRKSEMPTWNRFRCIWLNWMNLGGVFLFREWNLLFLQCTLIWSPQVHSSTHHLQVAHQSWNQFTKDAFVYLNGNLFGGGVYHFYSVCLWFCSSFAK